MKVVASRDAFCDVFVAFSVKKTPVVVAVMITPSLMESWMFFFQWKLLNFIVFFSKVYGVALAVDPIFH